MGAASCASTGTRSPPREPAGSPASSHAGRAVRSPSAPSRSRTGRRAGWRKPGWTIAPCALEERARDRLAPVPACDPLAVLERVQPADQDELGLGGGEGGLRLHVDVPVAALHVLALHDAIARAERIFGQDG